MKLKKLFAGVVAVAMMATMAFPAFAEGEEVVVSGPSITKTYKLTNRDTTSPAENFTFTATPTKVLHAGVKDGRPVTKDDAPALTIAQAVYDQGNASVGGSDKVLAVSHTTPFPNVGVYYYTVTETASTYAGVTTHAGDMLLKVTVAYENDDSTQLKETYAFYTATNENGEGQGTKNQAVENTYSAGTLDVSKKVTGSLGDKNKKFDVTVTFTAPAGKTVEAPITYTENDENKTIESTAWANGVATVTIHLAHGEHVLFNNIPYDVTYNVVEADYTTEANGGYDEASYTFSDTAKKIDSAADTVQITNNNGAMIDTGVILDNAPYILMLAVVAGGAMMLVIKKRRAEEE